MLKFVCWNCVGHLFFPEVFVTAHPFDCKLVRSYHLDTQYVADYISTQAAAYNIHVPVGLSSVIFDFIRIDYIQKLLSGLNHISTENDIETAAIRTLELCSIPMTFTPDPLRIQNMHKL